MKPYAFIAINKNRVKHNSNTVYLQDKTEFQLELFNPTGDDVLAKIWLNNNLISSSGIIIRPGQRIYLDRYLDSPEKFVFNTYDVENINEVKTAIANNGKVKVSFYKKTNLTSSGTITITNPGTWNPWITYPYPTNPYPTNPLWCGTSSDSFTFNSNSDSYTLTNNTFYTNFSKSIETGRVDKGDKSNQQLEYVTMDFENTPMATSNLTILPHSRQKIVKYCTSCGSKIKKSSWSFCPHCGTNVQ